MPKPGNRPLFPMRGARYQQASMPILFLIVFVDLVGFGLIIPLLPFYAERFGASPQTVTLLLAIFSLMSMLAAPLWGRLSDRIGRRPVLMASMAAAALAYLWLGFASELWMLFAARAFAGICAGNIAAAQARRARSRIAALYNAFGRPVLGRLLAVFFLVILAFAGMEGTFALWAMREYGWGPAQIGYVFTYVGLLSAVMQGGLIGPLTRRFGEERLMQSGLALIALGLLLLPVAGTLPPLIVAVTALSIGMGAMQPSLNSLISRRAGPDEQGEVVGIAQSVGSLARVLGPIIAGALFEAFGRNSPFLWGAVLVGGA